MVRDDVAPARPFIGSSDACAGARGGDTGRIREGVASVGMPAGFGRPCPGSGAVVTCVPSDALVSGALSAVVPGLGGSEPRSARDAGSGAVAGSLTALPARPGEAEAACSGGATFGGAMATRPADPGVLASASVCAAPCGEGWEPSCATRTTMAAKVQAESPSSTRRVRVRAVDGAPCAASGAALGRTMNGGDSAACALRAGGRRASDGAADNWVLETRTAGSAACA